MRAALACSACEQQLHKQPLLALAESPSRQILLPPAGKLHSYHTLHVHMHNIRYMCAYITHITCLCAAQCTLVLTRGLGLLKHASQPGAMRLVIHIPSSHYADAVSVTGTLTGSAPV